MSNPDFDQMWAAFPDHADFPTLKDLYTFLGGTLVRNIVSPGFGANGNTCATRISRALNYGGAPLSRERIRKLGLTRLTGDDGRFYLFRVSEMRTYLAATLDSEPRTVRNGFREAFAGERGIIAFRVRGWSDATGHIALWNGSEFREEHDDYRALEDDPDTVFQEAFVESMTLWPL